MQTPLVLLKHKCAWIGNQCKLLSTMGTVIIDKKHSKYRRYA